MTVGQACKHLGLVDYDCAIPQSFFNDMQAMFPNEYFCAVWSYDPFDDGRKNFMGYPRPLTKDAINKLIAYNTKFNTYYPTNFKTID